MIRRQPPAHYNPPPTCSAQHQGLSCVEPAGHVFSHCHVEQDGRSAHVIRWSVSPPPLTSGTDAEP